jgi:prepilin-type N-terminal cleavage/methylation domain-containing protein
MQYSNQQWSVVCDPWSVVRCRQLIAGRRRALTTDHWPQTTRAFTLVELMIVVIIVGMVTVATIPLLKPALDGRRIREAARIVSTQFAAAQSEAVADGHSVGVWMEKLPNDSTASMDLYLCESPQPYSGDTEASTVVVQVTQTGTKPGVVEYPGASPQTVPLYQAAFTINMAVDTAWVGLLRAYDTISFGFKGAKYRILGSTDSFGQPANAVDSNGFLQSTSTVIRIEPVDPDDFVYDYSSGSPALITFAFRKMPPLAFVTTTNPTGWTTPYEIVRQPIKSANTPVQLPSGAVVDLFYSGMGGSYLLYQAPQSPPITANQFISDAHPVIATFDRTGALEYLYVNGQQTQITHPLYFLIGKREKLASVETDPTKQNSADLENIWVSINPQSGLVSTAEVASGSGFGISASRALATSAQAMGGK